MIRRFLTFSAALLCAGAVPLVAQTGPSATERLSRYLRELASDPNSVSALIGAGQAALDVGDGNAALGFFARADERFSRNGGVKAGLGRALLMMDNHREALKQFEAARALGVPDLTVAGDRGYAYDLSGDSRRAQQDYALALTRGPNDEIIKRYALSLAITGQRDQALRLLDPLLYRRDQGAWRARAFVLALTGDPIGASKIVHQVMPARMAATMDGFLGKLGGLTPAQKAAAVHLGELPQNARIAVATPVPAPTPAPVVLASRTVSVPPREVRRRPAVSLPVASPIPTRVTRVQPTPASSANPTPAPAIVSTPTPAPVQIVEQQVSPPVLQAQPLAAPVRTAPPASLPSSSRGDLDAVMREILTGAATPPRVTPTPRPSPTPVRVAQVTPRPTPTPVAKPTPKPSLTPRIEAKKGRDDVAKVDPKTGKPLTKAQLAKLDTAKKKPEPKAPPRIWVQVAGGSNVRALPREWSGLPGKAAELKGKGPFTARNGATNRLLAGPFKSEAEAQAAVSKLRKAGVGAFQWKSDEGEAVEKLGGK